VFFNTYAAIRRQRGGVGKSAMSLASLLFKARPKARRRHQVLELYQKKYPMKVKAALKASEFDTLNEAAQCRDEDSEWVDDEDEQSKENRLKEGQSKRMKVWRRVVQETWDAETEEVQTVIRELAKEEVQPVKSISTEDAEGEPAGRTPEEYQM
jgi:hypothetical protein